MVCAVGFVRIRYLKMSIQPNHKTQEQSSKVSRGRKVRENHRKKRLRLIGWAMAAMSVAGCGHRPSPACRPACGTRVVQALGCDNRPLAAYVEGGNWHVFFDSKTMTVHSALHKATYLPEAF